MATLANSFFDWIFFILAGNKDRHKSLNDFKFLPDPTTEGQKNQHILWPL